MLSQRSLNEPVELSQRHINTDTDITISIIF